MSAQKTNIASASLRFDDWGPGYLAEEEHAAFGVVRLRPGDEFPNHYHEHHEESFLVLDGEFELWLDQADRLTLSRGDFVRCAPHVQHYLRNVGAVDATAFFVKAPGVPGDKVDFVWRPPNEGGAT